MGAYVLGGLLIFGVVVLIAACLAILALGEWHKNGRNGE